MKIAPELFAESIAVSIASVVLVLELLYTIMKNNEIYNIYSYGSTLLF